MLGTIWRVLVYGLKSGVQTPLSLDGSGNLNVNLAAGGGSGGTSDADGSTHTPGATLGVPAQGVYESSPSLIADGKLGTVGITNDRKLKVSGSFSSSPITAGTSVLSNVAASAASVTVLAANAARLGATFYNDDPAVSVFVKPGATASATSFGKKLLPLEFRTLQDLFGVNYTGKVDAIWESAPSGTMRVVELTA